MSALIRFLPDSRTVLRTGTGLAVMIALLFLPAASRNSGRLDEAGHHNIGLWVSMTPWVLLGIAVILATTAEIEDAVFRRRVALAGTTSLVILGFGFAARAVFGARSEWFGLLQGLMFWGAMWASGGHGFNRFRGFGPWIDAPLERWLGPPRSETETALRARDRQIREAASLEERTRLAQDLHDSIKQEIFAIHTSAATIQERLETDPDGARAALAQVRRSSRDAMTEIEALLDRLDAAPLENTGLVAALKKQCEALGLRTGADVACVIGDLPPSKLLPPGTHEALFRIAQEALSNVGKHARATHVRLTLELAERYLLLTITDNGQGFDKRDSAHQARLGMGLMNMLARSRAVGGRFELVTSPGDGATIRVDVPVYQPSVFFQGVPRWLVVGSTVIVALPMVFVAAHFDWSVLAMLAIYVIIMFYSVRRGMRDSFKS